MIPLRKEHAGSCNLGYTWLQDGSVVDVEPEHAVLLLAIPDGDYTAVDSEPAGEAHAGPEATVGDTAIEEPAPASDLSESPPPRKAVAKRTSAKKSAAETGSAATEDPAPVEE